MVVDWLHKRNYVLNYDAFSVGWLNSPRLSTGAFLSSSPVSDYIYYIYGLSVLVSFVVVSGQLLPDILTVNG